ncbi:glycosyl hydrolase family 65 protein [Streptomyces sp. V3I7]|uniref:glycosyl hydrolase family 65 protein n=1 Tax=Streptomyces sp. V3I7 TaxID=3042278 RepID=UPI0027813C2B|nr:glycosyl hydrolase family 65 protein [Streptomyces sp. V3I7]MDQ0994573.1 trehalose/maltose hydrolase-like predicted phosphorylase [Streptomyces sp. V3I7]
MSAPSSEPVPDDWVLATDDPLTDYHPAFTGNGYLAARVPAAGNGFAEAPIRTQFHVAGLYTGAEGEWARKASLPAWTTLDVGDGSGTFNTAFAPEPGQDEAPAVGGDWAPVDSPLTTVARGIAGYRQTLDLRTGVIATAARWTSPAGRVTDVRYEILTARHRTHTAAVTVTVTPHWDGTLEVTDALDERGALRTRDTRQGATGGPEDLIWLTTAARGSSVTAAVAAALHAPADARAETAEGTAVRRIGLPVRAGTSYTFTKYVGLATSHDTADPLALAREAALEAAACGYERLAEDSRAAWAREWQGDITVHGDERLRRQVRAAKFYLLTSARAGLPWSPSPAGLSSDGYNGHVFWDTETWIWPSLLAQHPDIAESVLDYRLDRLDAAYANAARGGDTGARFPWESSLDGSEDTPSWAPFGDYELHVTSDVALAFWQYWLATGDETWLRAKGWPVLRGAADFWASRAVLGADGRYHLSGVIPPDEYAIEPHDDSAYTNASAAAVLRFATEAAAVLGEPADPAWYEAARGLVVPFDERLGVHPEFAGYEGEQIKQADVVMLAYPWEHPQDEAVTRADLEYYLPRTHEDGPSMTDSVHAIVYAQLGEAEAALDRTRHSVDPFVRAPFEQFAEARKGGAFTFLTGHGGFLQVFLYGYSGLRWRPDRVVLAPILPAALDGITLSRLHWRGRVFDVDIRHEGTTVRLRSGPELPVEAEGHVYRVRPGEPLTLRTRG